VKEIIAAVDDDGNGKIEYPEFKTLMDKKMICQDPPQAIREAFKAIDVNSTGKVHVGELRYVLTGIGAKLTDEEVDEILKEANVVDGYLEYEEFIKMVVADQ